MEAHVAGCPGCSDELRTLETAWRSLPPVGELRAPAALRRSVVERAHRAVDAGTTAASGFSDQVWGAVKESVGPIGVGAVAALGVVLLLHLRGAVADLSPLAAAVTGLTFTALLATAAGGVLQSGGGREVRGIFSGALGALGGYVLLTFLSPIPETVDFCRITLLGDPALGITELCLIHLGVAGLYAGIPIAAAAYRWPGRQLRWRGGLVAAAAFASMAAPVVIFQFGLTEWMITATGLLGLLLGALAGGLAGTWAASHRAAGL